MDEVKDAELRKSRAGDQGSAAYWTEHMVAHEDFSDVADSIDHFEWRSAQYPGYIDLMPVNGHDGKVIVDYGCGPGNDLIGFSVYSNPQKLIGLDVSETALSASEKRLKLHGKQAELVQIEEEDNQIPLEAESVDLIHTSGVLHHCKNLDAVLSELNRILRPGGEMQVMVYNYESLWVHLYTAFIHQIEQALYSECDIREAFRQTTDGQYCPVSRCYKPKDFLADVEKTGFTGEFVGASISLTELRLLPRRFDAIGSRKLAKEHRDFLSELTFNSKGIPISQGAVAGIGGCYKFIKR
ncbi:MAG: class I SAM-dependent methyltransferase [Verrucomicrobiota bacterium]